VRQRERARERETDRVREPPKITETIPCVTALRHRHRLRERESASESNRKTTMPEREMEVLRERWEANRAREVQMERASEREIERER